MLRRGVAGVCLFAACAVVAEERRLLSPDGAVQAVVSVDPEGRLVYAVSFHGVEAVAESPVGLTLDGVDLGKVSALTAMSVREAQERYPTRGAHAAARFDALQALYNVRPQAGPSYGLQVTVANEGFAWRLLVPGKGVRRVEAEVACWRLPPASRVWFAERLPSGSLKTPAGAWASASLCDLHTVSARGAGLALPLVAELPEARGYALVTEAALSGYSGLRLQAEPDGRLRGVFSEKEGFPQEGRIVTPWRVVLLAPDLNALANSDLAASLNPPPDPALFGTFDWTAGGRGAWGGEQASGAAAMTAESEKRRIDGAARLTFEFVALNEAWEAWTDAGDVLKEVCEYGKTKRVRVFVGKPAAALTPPESAYLALRAFLDRVRDAGAAGVSVDGLSSGDLGQVVFEERLLREAASRNLLVHVRGRGRPAGESRTYPNLLAGEGVCGLEGQADGTPLALPRPGDTTWAHQLAVAYLGASPLLLMADAPQPVFDEPRLAEAIPFLQRLPVTWDETRVLDGSRLGELTALARRAGSVWYVAMANRTANLKMVSFTPGFTGWRQARLSQLADVAGQADDLTFSTRLISGTAPLIVALEPCGGFVARLERE